MTTSSNQVVFHLAGSQPANLSQGNSVQNDAVSCSYRKTIPRSPANKRLIRQPGQCGISWSSVLQAAEDRQPYNDILAILTLAFFQKLTETCPIRPPFHSGKVFLRVFAEKPAEPAAPSLRPYAWAVCFFQFCRSGCTMWPFNFDRLLLPVLQKQLCNLDCVLSGTLADLVTAHKQVQPPLVIT